MANAALAAVLAAELLEGRTKLAAEFDSHKTTKDGQVFYDIPAEKIEGFRKRNADLDALGKRWEGARDMEEIQAKNAETVNLMMAPQRPGVPGVGVKAKGEDGASESLGELFARKYYQHDSRGVVLVGEDGKPLGRKGQDLQLPGVQFKATMTTSAGFSPENLRSGRVVLSAQRPLAMLDLVPMIPITQGNSYVYQEETTFTNNAAEIAENDSTGAPEVELVYTEKSKDARRIAALLPVTDEQLADTPGIIALVNGRGVTMVRQRADYQILQGNGTAPNIHGFYAQVSQAQAKAGDPTFDAIFKGMTKVQSVGFGQVDGVVIHPNDWQEIRLTRTVDGMYILGNPGDAAPERLFGAQVIPTVAATEGTALVGDFATHSAFVYINGVEVKVSDSHADFFKKFLQAIRFSFRGNLVVFRPSAFCEVTGI